MPDDNPRLDDLHGQKPDVSGRSRPQYELALDAAGPLIRFVAESGKLSDPSLTAAIGTAHEARYAGNAWDPNLSTNFWGAYNQLCALAAPVTVDAIVVAATADRPNRWRWFTGSRRRVTLSQLTADNYVALLLLTIAAALVVQLYAWGLDTSSRQIATAAAPMQALSVDVSQRDTLLTAQTLNIPTKNWTEPEHRESAAIQGQATLLAAGAASVCTSASALRAWMGLPVPAAKAAPACDAKLGPPAAYETPVATSAWARTSAYVGTVQARAQIVAGVLNGFLLPVLFGLAGAVVYVVRTISEQIKTTTFTSVSPLRHRIRVSLGPLMGLIIGLFVSVLQLPSGFSLLALAFLAGYAVEAVMSLFDGIVASVTKPK
jgi:hypothetical protein